MAVEYHLPLSFTWPAKYIHLCTHESIVYHWCLVWWALPLARVIDTNQKSFFGHGLSVSSSGSTNHIRWSGCCHACLMHFAFLNSYAICFTLSTYLSSMHLVRSRFCRQSTLGWEFISHFILDPRISNITGWYALLCFSLISDDCQFTAAIRLVN